MLDPVYIFPSSNNIAAPTLKLEYGQYAFSLASKALCINSLYFHLNSISYIIKIPITDLITIISLNIFTIFKFII